SGPRSVRPWPSGWSVRYSAWRGPRWRSPPGGQRGNHEGPCPGIRGGGGPPAPGAPPGDGGGTRTVRRLDPRRERDPPEPADIRDNHVLGSGPARDPVDSGHGREPDPGRQQLRPRDLGPPNGDGRPPPARPGRPHGRLG